MVRALLTNMNSLMNVLQHNKEERLCLKETEPFCAFVHLPIFPFWENVLL